MIFFWLGVIAMLALAFVWLGARLFFRPAIEALAGAARRWSEGDFSARAELKRGPDELLRLAEVFDLMAASFEERERERLRTEESLRKSQTSLEAAQARARIGS
jgi:nitrogen fixation/metabolism regulation signal transduction histidine kinase